MSDTQASSLPYVLVAPNGARRSHADHPALPVSTGEIVETAVACHAAGANGLHLHVRDGHGAHSLDAGRYREAMAELAGTVPTMDVQITTEAAGIYDVSAQLECLQQVAPKWASISVREIARAPDLAPRVYALCAEQGTRVQHILYGSTDADLLERWQSDGIVRREQEDRLLVLGRYATGQESEPADLEAFPAARTPWMVCAFGRLEHACLAAAAARGGDVRVGFENSLTNSDGTRWTDNATSVAALIALLKGK
ncbi:3-keto-5-aminohexanoate cleavage protein [Ruegeria arenilitoris]|uniref:3-keto-5-aminohexanoate cleavage protein n=1 Tax=Ruegeria arenilitoris TaxID=1173585 RepID=UPI0014819AB9|nr:3-keto-5-aminohexanoate cleavage protein [Ruegeria arenilitoris]